MIEATGLTPEQLRQKLATAAQRFVQDPNVAVVVEQVNSRHVFITAQAVKPGPYPSIAALNVLQLISVARDLPAQAD